MRRWILISALLTVGLTTQGCAKLFGGLRSDFDDGYRNQPTTGGVWPERQMLDQADLQTPSVYDDYAAVGHSERVPAQYDSSRAWGSNDAQGVERIGSPEDVMQQEARQAKMQAQENARKFKNGSRATRSDFIDDSQSEGSLWASGGQTNYFFTKNSIKNPGDIITVKTEEPFIKDVAADVKRTLSDDEMEDEIDNAKKSKTRSIASTDAAPAAGGAAAPAADQVKSSAASASNPADPFKDEDVKATAADVDLSKSVGIKAGDTIMAEIVERYPSGNYKIRGTKRLNYHGSVRMLTFVGIARAADIGEGDVIDSGKLYEYKLNVQR